MKCPITRRPATGIRPLKDHHARHLQRSRDVRYRRVIADQQPGIVQQGGERAQRHIASRIDGGSAHDGAYIICQIPFGGRAGQHDLQPGFYRKLPGDLREMLRRPALAAITRTRMKTQIIMPAKVQTPPLQLSDVVNGDGNSSSLLKDASSSSAMVLPQIVATAKRTSASSRSISWPRVG